MHSTITASAALLSPEDSLDSGALPCDAAPDVGPSESSALGEDPTAQEPPTCPVAAELRDIQLSLPTRAGERLHEASDLVGALAYKSWVEAAADVVLDAMLTDVQSGHLPKPSENPAEIERALAARAEEAVRQSPYVHTFHWLHGAFQILRHAECGPAGRFGARWRTPIEPFVRVGLEPRRSEGDAAPSVDAGATPAGLCVLRPGERHPAPLLGLGVQVQWEEYALRVLRDDVLSSLASDGRAERGLLLVRRQTGGPEMLPCRVYVAPPPTEMAPPTKRKRRGH